MKATSIQNLYNEAKVICINKNKSADISLINCSNEFLLIYDNGIRKKIDVSDIIMIKSESNYSNIILHNNRSIFTSKTIKHWSTKFRNDKLVRVHNSYLINIDKVVALDRLNSKLLLLEDKEVSYSRSMKKYILNLFNPN